MTNDFLHKKLSEKEKEEIKKRAKEIMDNFAEKLAEIEETKIEENENKNFERKEKDSNSNYINRATMFQNAPNKNKDFIIAEKKKW